MREGGRLGNEKWCALLLFGHFDKGKEQSANLKCHSLMLFFWEKLAFSIRLH